MSADTNKNSNPRPQSTQGHQPNAERVRSTHYEWERELPPEKAEPQRPLKRSAERVNAWAQHYLDLARKAFGADDDLDFGGGKAADMA